MDFQTCDSVMMSSGFGLAGGPSIFSLVVSVMICSDLRLRVRVGPLTLLPEELHAAVDPDVAVVGDPDLEPLERTRRGAFEVDRQDVAAALEVEPAETGAVAGALELVLDREPA